MAKKILQIGDSAGWAIDSLAKTVVAGSPHLDWKRIFIHPKDLEQGKVDLEPVREAIAWADVVDVEYWRVLSQLLDLIPELKDKPVFLAHHNEKNIFSYDWPDNVFHVATTKYSEKVLLEKYPAEKVFYVPNCFDEKLFHYIREYPPKEKAVGYVGRIVPWKGLKDIAKACYELGYPLLVMGKMDKPSYFAEIPKEHQDIIDWSFFNCQDKDRPEFYKNITVYVGNSGGGRETGPLGLMEAMASGVPCVSTSAGIVADIGEHDVNMLMVDYDDYDSLKDSINTLIESSVLQARLRKSAWETIRNYNSERRGLLYRKIFNDFFNGVKPLVSFIIPTTPERRPELKAILNALEKQTYRTIEAVVVFDQALDQDQAVLDFLAEAKQYSFAVKVLATGRYGDYNLAMARNLGVIEADGDYLIFNDSRMEPEPEAVAQFLSAIQDRHGNDKVWLFGEKGGGKNTFVENFSMIRRQDFINAGMMNERITEYGGMSQELRTRFNRQGYEFEYVPSAKARQLLKSPQTSEKKDGIIRMKNLLYRLNLNG